jgi:hypothetical protein
MAREGTPETGLQLMLMIGNAIPMWARVCLLSIGLFGWILISTGNVRWLFPGFARQDEVRIEVAAVVAQLGAQISNVQQQVTREGNQDRARYSEQIDSQLLDAAAKCHDSKNAEAKHLYQRSQMSLIEQYRRLNSGQDPPTGPSSDCG